MWWLVGEGEGRSGKSSDGEGMSGKSNDEDARRRLLPPKSVWLTEPLTRTRGGSEDWSGDALSGLVKG